MNVIFERTDHSLHGLVTFVELENGSITVSLDSDSRDTYTRSVLISDYVRWYKENNETYASNPYSKALHVFFRKHYTEEEWALAALENL